MSFLTAKDLMEKAHLVSPEESIEKIKKLLVGHEDILLVVDNDGKFLGEIPESNLLKLIVSEDFLDEEDVVGILGSSYDDDFVANSASSIMTSHNFVVKPKTKAEDIAVLLYKEDIESLAVVDKGKVVGVIHLNKFIEKMLK